MARPINNNRDKLGRFSNNVNEWTFDEDNAYCYLNGELLFFTDKHLYPSLKEHSFAKLANGYAGVCINRKVIGVHRLINKPEKNQLVDHINRNKKDNRLCNLRNTDKSLNAFNSKIRSNNTSGITGVEFRKDTKRWTASIRKNCKVIRLGCFATKEEAARARKEAEVIYYGNQ